jgi:acyl-CoA thioesterase I
VLRFIRLFLLGAVMMGSAHAASPTRILFLGDSLTEGYGIAVEDAYPALVEHALKKDGFSVTVVNAGVSGSTTSSGPSRLRWHLKAKPDIVVVALGANDGLRGLPVTEIRKNLITTIELAKDQKLKILLAGMKMPPNYGAQYSKNFEAIFPELAKKYAIPLVPFLLDQIAGEPDLNLADGIHPNEKGHQLMAKTMTQALKPLLQAGS